MRCSEQRHLSRIVGMFGSCGFPVTEVVIGVIRRLALFGTLLTAFRFVSIRRNKPVGGVEKHEIIIVIGRCRGAFAHLLDCWEQRIIGLRLGFESSSLFGSLGNRTVGFTGPSASRAGFLRLSL